MDTVTQLNRSEAPARRATPARPPSRLRRLFVTGPDDDPGWARPALWGLLLVTAVLYVWNLSNSGTANSFYAAAAKSGTMDLRAWLFGSLDAGNAITVDKPPASLWLMVLSCRIFGFSSFAMLLPQALMGIGTVALVHASVKRWAGAAAGLIAGALVAVTPVAALMFRFNNPDAALVFLMTLAAYCVVRAVDAPAERRRAALGWLLAAGTAIGFAFLTKLMQGLLVLPGLGAAYLVAGAGPVRRRLVNLVAALGAVIVSAGWFIALVAIWPAAARPYIGGSTDNSLWELAIGYNGLGRIFGGSGNMSGGGGGGGTGFGGSAGLLRMFNSAFGTEISWLLPAAAIAFVAAIGVTAYAPTRDRLRTGAILWGGWLGVSALVFSFMEGTIHPYYSVALAPAIAALVAMVAVALWERRESSMARGTLALMIVATGLWGGYLLHRDAAGWNSWLTWLMIVGSLVGALGLLVAAGDWRKYAVVAVLIGSLSALSGTTAFTVATAATGHTGSTPTSGPSSVSSGGFGGGRGGFGGGGPGGPGQTSSQSSTSSGTGTSGTGTGTGTGTSAGTGTSGTAPSGTRPSGGFGNASGSSTAVDTLLKATTSRWSAAVVGSQSAAQYILSSGTSVMAIGGWSGTDPAPTLAQFKKYVVEGKIAYFIASGSQMGGGMGGSTGSGSEITAWVKANFSSSTVGGTTVYDLTKSK